MNAVWNSYGQLCGCPEIFKKSCKFFCRELDIRVPDSVNVDAMTDEELYLKLKAGYADAKAGRVQDADAVFAKFLEEHGA
ncbi:MAG: hypothetical protein ACLVC5_02105 [Clostridia bacterium]